MLPAPLDQVLVNSTTGEIAKMVTNAIFYMCVSTTLMVIVNLVKKDVAGKIKTSYPNINPHYMITAFYCYSYYHCRLHTTFYCYCCRLHNFGTTHARKVLAAHNLGGLRHERQILSVLQSNEAPGIDSDSSEDDMFTIWNNLATGGNAKRKQSTPEFTTMSNDLSDEKTEICGFNLRGKCSYGNKCNALHTGNEHSIIDISVL